ncbi:MAG: hypothetical protein JRI26_12605 [Deltaproteobacteria bacterium]|nr:hypothetical protein [Deltaproteobacteria bacterium]
MTPALRFEVIHETEIYKLQKHTLSLDACLCAMPAPLRGRHADRGEGWGEGAPSPLSPPTRGGEISGFLDVQLSVCKILRDVITWRNGESKKKDGYYRQLFCWRVLWTSWASL